MSTYTRRGSVAVITMANPPMNTMSHANRGAVRAALAAANADAEVKAVVITGGGRVFSSGAEIREFNTPAATAAPALGEVIKAIEESPKPVVAAIHGVAMGGGWRSAATIASARAARSSRCRRSSSACCRAPAAPSACRAWWACNRVWT